MNIKEIRNFRKTLRRFERLLYTHINSNLCCCGVSLTQCHTILQIGEQKEITIIDLAQALELDKSTLSRTVDALVNLGYVERVVHPGDRRFVLITLTNLGKKTYEQINKNNDEFFQGVFNKASNHTPEEIIDNFTELVTAMGKMLLDKSEEQKS